MQSGPINDEAVVSLVIDASGLRRGSSEAADLSNKIRASLKGVEDAARAAGATITGASSQIIKATNDQARALNKIERDINPLRQAYRGAAQDLSLLNKLFTEGGPLAEKAGNLIGGQTQKVLQLSRSYMEATGQIDAYNRRLKESSELQERNNQAALRRYQQMINEARQLQNTANSQQAFNNVLGVNPGSGMGAARTSASVFEASFAQQEAEVKRLAQGRKELFDQETRNNERLAASQTAATNIMINNLKRFQSEQQRSLTEGFKFQEQMAPSSNIEEHRRQQKKATDDLAKSAKDAADRIDYLSNRFNQDATAAKNYRATIADLNEAFAKGVIGHRELGIETSKAIDVYNRSTIAGKAALDANNKHSQSLQEVGLNSRLAQYAMTNFSFQVNDVVSGLVMGQAPFRIFAQQAGQIVQIFQQIGRENLGQFFRNMASEVASFGAAIGRWLITPWGAVITGATAAIGVLTVMLTRSAGNAQILREFDQAIGGVGTRSEATSRDLLKLSFDLRAIGVSADDANKSIGMFARNLNIQLLNPNAIRQLTQLGLNAGARLGVGDAEGINQFNQAINNSVEGLVEFGLRTRAITTEQASAALVAAQLGNRLRTENQLIAEISTNLTGQHEKLRSGWSKFIDSIGAGWQAIINKISDTGAFTAVDAFFNRMANNLRYIIENGKLAPGTVAGNIAGSGQPPRQVVMNPTISGAIQSAIDWFTAGTPKQGATVAGPVGSFNTFREPNLVSGGYPFSSISNPGRGFPALPNIPGIPGSAFGVGGFGFPFTTAGERSNIPPSASGRDWPFSGLPMTTTRPGITNIVLENANLDLGNAGLSVGERQSVVSRISAEKEGSLALSPDMRRLSDDVLKQGGLAVAQYTAELVKSNRASEEAITIAGKRAIEQRGEAAFFAERAAQLQAGRSATEAAALAEVKRNEALKVGQIELAKSAEEEALKTKGLLSSADAYGKTAVEGIKAEAMAQAELLSLTTGVDKRQKYNEILLAGAAAALLAAGQQNIQARLQLENESKIAQASGVSAKAQKDAEITAKAATQTQDALNKALATGNETLIAAARASQLRAEALIREREAVERLKQANEFVRLQTDQQAQIRLQAGLLSQPPEVQQANLVMLQKEQELRRANGGLLDEAAKKQLEALATTQRMNIVLAEGQREWQRIEDMVRSVATTIDNTLTRAVEDAFNGKKVTDWGAQIKSMLSSLAAQMTSALFIKPLLGSILGGLGFGNVASGFGNLFGSGGGGGLLGGLFGGSSGGGGTGTNNVGLTQVGTNAQGQPIFSLSNLSSGASLINNVSGGGGLFGSSSGGGLFGNVGSFLNNSIGVPLGFAPSSVAGTTSLGAGTTIGQSFGSWNSMGGPQVGSLFGGTSFTGFLGGVGAGFGAGSLVNSLAGGNTLFGSVGSGLGSIAGTLIGGPIGGIIGGALGGLVGGMFGNNKPRNASAGGSIDLTTGKIATFTGGNQQIDQPTLQAVQQVGAFTQMLLKGTGGTLPPGSILLQNGVNTGFTADSNLPGYSGRFNLGKDATEAARLVELALARSIENVSETTKLIISKIEDPAQIERGIAFASVYDNLKKAADSAFTSIAGDTQQIGPFAQALENIKGIFEEITDTTNEFGLSLDPVNAALAEANKRLTEDFNRSINEMILAITDPTALALEVEKRAGEARVKEAEAVAGDITKVQELNALLIKQILDQTTEEIDQTAEDIKNQLQGIEDFRRELLAGALSGKTIFNQTTAALDQFNQAFMEVMGGDLTRAGDVVKFGQSALELSMQGAGNAPQTTDLRNVILSDINTVLAGRGFAEGTTDSPPGWIQVHKDEWMYQRGGSVVLPRGQTPPGMDTEDITSELELLRRENSTLMATNNELSRQIGIEIVRELGKQTRVLEKNQSVYTPARNAV